MRGDQTHQHGFRFGIEAEFILLDAHSLRPLWHRDLQFETLNAALEAIPVADVGCEGLQAEPPHRKASPYVVEGYHLPDPEMNPIDLLPKGVEIRTPIRNTINGSLEALKILHTRMQQALHGLGYRAAALSFHPTEVHFEGPKNKRRHDYWQWAMEAMVTYGPDVNVGVPPSVAAELDLNELSQKVNYYVPALTALTLASPLRDGGLWRIRGRVGKSVRTYHRSATAPAIEIHPDQGLRLELKPFEMTTSLDDYRNYFLLWLGLILDERLKGRASDQTRVYDLGRVACEGVAVDTVSDRAAEVLDVIPEVLTSWGFDCSSLELLRKRLSSKRVPADEIVEIFEREKSVEQTLKHLCDLN
jgi:hypothetical protein